MHHRRTVIALVFLAALVPAARADEGMWLPNQPPLAQLRDQYGFEPSPAWLEHVRKASVRFHNGGSASFISPDGLILTNHHVGSDAIQALSDAENDYMRDGFYAPTRDKELKCPEIELNVLEKLEDVTDRVNQGVTPDMSPSDAAALRKKNMAEIEKTARENSAGLTPEIVTLYQGARYHLYQYRRYTDVRLVMAPEKGIAFFGGDVDNFEYPRFNLDCCFFRAYEEGKPAKIEHYLKWNEAGPAADDLIFCSGHPGHTQRLNTVDHLYFLRDTYIPLILAGYNQREVALIQFASRGAEEKRVADEDLLYIQNGRKAWGGILAGLLDPRTIAAKKTAEEELRAFVNADESRKRNWGDAWSDLAAALKKSESYYPAYFLLGNRRASLCRQYDIAIKLVRAADERRKPDGERLPEFRDAALPSLELDLFSEAPIHASLEQLRLEDGLVRLARILGGDHEIVKAAFGGDNAQSRAANILNSTKLKDVSFRKKLYEGGSVAIEESNDAMIRFAIEMDRFARPLRKKYEEEVESVQTQSYAAIARARFEKLGDAVYPDATFTLRLSVGTVKGYEEAGTSIPPFTTFAGLYERAEEHEFRPPYDLPRRWIERKDRLNLDQKFNFVSTNDLIGGNSGSPMIGRGGELVGLVFDGNVHSLIWDIQFDQVAARAVSVHSGAMIEALRKIYEADALVEEILGKN